MSKRGIIICPTCSTGNGARSYFCKQCNHRFKEGSPKPVKSKGCGQRGKKSCPQCKDIVGVRTFVCACGYNFKPGVEKKTQVYQSQGLSRGKKKCPDCNEIVAARTSLCNCGHVFYATKGVVSEFNPSPKIKRSADIFEDWTTLKHGIKIKVLPGKGDHYIAPTGEKVYMQDPGVYSVEKVDNTGIVVHGKSGLGYIYMGETKKSEISDSVVKQAHEIILA